MNAKKIIIGIVAVGILSFGYYAISPLFINIKVDESLPGSIKSPEMMKKNEPVMEKKEDSSMMGDDKKMMEKGDIMMKEESAMGNKGAEVVGTAGHPASGTARIVSADGKNYVRYENFKTINGPDIYVYLSKDLEANDFVSLGRVKATEGNINYEIPSTVNSSDYPYVLTWCKVFGVLFNSAKIN